jgi:putative ABC transport system substrate-binding protein
LSSALTAREKQPVVMIVIDYDPIARGYIKSLAKPADNVTGLYFQLAEIAGKHLQLIKDAFPDFKVAAVLFDRASADYWPALQTAAARLGVRVVGVQLGEPPHDYERAISAVPRDDRKFLIAMASPFFFLDRVRLSELALRQKTYWWPRHALLSWPAA